MIYLASPYSHPDPSVREQRFRKACAATVRLIHAGHTVISPVVHGYPLVEHGMATDWQAWERNNRALLARCDEVVVLMLEGWQDSIGVLAEVAFAGRIGKAVRRLTHEPGDCASQQEIHKISL